MSLRTMFASALGVSLLVCGAASSQSPAPRPGLQPGPADAGPINSVITGDLVPTHDPVLVREKGTYYVYGTGLNIKTSPDLIHWTAQPKPFAALPDWATKAIPGSKDMWAPDLSFWNGRWHLYYAVSTFGSNRSAIGLATSPTLDPQAPGYGWRDEGAVVMSRPSDDFNAIDANHVADREGRHWLALGSFWTGIKLFELDPITGKLLHPGQKPVAIARRPAPAGAPAPVEAPFIIGHGAYYYLFVSYDYCCKGANSTYYTVFGRSARIDGPYVGKDGSRLMDGGGTIVLRADLQEQERFRGPGHPGIFHDTDGKDYIVYHAYDKAHQGAPTLRISPLRWTHDGWPETVR